MIAPGGDLNFNALNKYFMKMESIFKVLLVLGVIVFCILIITFFLFSLKLILLFTPQINLFGLSIT
jgi:hypothetical protein